MVERNVSIDDDGISVHKDGIFVGAGSSVTPSSSRNGRPAQERTSCGMLRSNSRQREPFPPLFRGLVSKGPVQTRLRRDSPFRRPWSVLFRSVPFVSCRKTGVTFEYRYSRPCASNSRNPYMGQCLHSDGTFLEAMKLGPDQLRYGMHSPQQGRMTRARNTVPIQSAPISQVKQGLVRANRGS
jgi:hypothetical protein